MLSIYTIYDHPSDYPDQYVIKKWDVQKGNTEPVQDPRYVYAGTDLEVCRDQMRNMGLVLMPREDSDDIVIIESWI